MEGKYNALDLAEKIIQISNSNGMYITNLQLQKIMYYTQGQFMKKFGYKAFEEKIECWPYGPVIKRVWAKFTNYGRRPILDIASDLEINNEEEKLISHILDEKLSMNVWDLVDQTHDELPWYEANLTGATYISDSSMEEFFCRD